MIAATAFAESPLSADVVVVVSSGFESAVVVVVVVVSVSEAVVVVVVVVSVSGAEVSVAGVELSSAGCEVVVFVSAETAPVSYTHLTLPTN